MQQQQRRRRRRRRLYERRAAVQDIRACLVFEHVLYAWEGETIEGGRGATEISWHAGSTQAARRQAQAADQHKSSCHREDHVSLLHH